MSGTKSASWPQWLASVESDLFTSDPVQRSKEWQGWTNLLALPVFCRDWRVDLAKARMSANTNEPALILEVAAEWPALKMQRLFSTVFFFLKPRVSCERKVGYNFYVFSAGPWLTGCLIKMPPECPAYQEEANSQTDDGEDVSQPTDWCHTLT